MEIGRLLQQTRIERGYSLDDIQEETKIQKKFLEAIENEQFELLPGKLYAKLFVKQYAKLLKLDIDEHLSDSFLDNVVIEQVDKSLNPETIEKVKIKKKKQKSKALEILPKIVFVIFSAAILGVITYMFGTYFYFGKDNIPVDPANKVVLEKNANNNESNINDNTKEEKAESDTDSKTENSTASSKLKQQLEVESIQEKTTKFRLLNAEKFVAKILATNDVWIKVTTLESEGSSKVNNEYEGILKKNEEKVFDLDKEAILTIQSGNVASTEIYVNNELLKYEIEPSVRSVQEIIIKK